jgi:alpha-glucosidase (family GH31 glycosyl hydrolase)
MHGSPKQVIAEYLHAIGHPDLPPFWALGWGQGSNSYDSLAKVQQALTNY